MAQLSDRLIFRRLVEKQWPWPQPKLGKPAPPITPALSESEVKALRGGCQRLSRMHNGKRTNVLLSTSRQVSGGSCPRHRRRLRAYWKEAERCWLALAQNSEARLGHSSAKRLRSPIKDTGDARMGAHATGYLFAELRGYCRTALLGRRLLPVIRDYSLPAMPRGRCPISCIISRVFGAFFTRVSYCGRQRDRAQGCPPSVSNTRRGDHSNRVYCEHVR